MVRASREPPASISTTMSSPAAPMVQRFRLAGACSALSKRTQTSALAPPGFNASRFNDLASRSIFPRNEPPNPAKYFSEGPEMTSHDEEPKEGRNNNT